MVTRQCCGPVQDPKHNSNRSPDYASRETVGMQLGVQTWYRPGHGADGWDPAVTAPAEEGTGDICERVHKTHQT